MAIIFILLLTSSFWLYIKYGNFYLSKFKFKRTRLVPYNLVKEKQFAKLKGVAEHNGALVTAPLSGTPCLFYTVTIEEHRGNRWHTLINTTWGKDFFVRCDSGKVLLRSASAYAHLNVSFDGSSGMFKDASDRIEKYLNRSGNSTTDALGFNRKLKYKETLLLPGEEVLMMGYGKWKNKNSSEEYLLLYGGEKAIYFTNLQDWVSKMSN